MGTEDAASGTPGHVEEQEEAKPRGQRARLRRLSLVFAALAILFGLLAVHAAMSGGGRVDGFRFPEELPSGATVVNAQAGPEAVSAVKSIHWDPGAVGITDAALVHYSDGTLLWLTAAEDACSLVDRMAQKIALEEERLPYTAPLQLSVDGVKVYLVADKRTGQVHAFWCRGKLAAWAQLGVNPADHGIVAETIRVLVAETSYEG